MLMMPKARRPENAPETEAAEKKADILMSSLYLDRDRLGGILELTSTAIAGEGRKTRGRKQARGTRHLRKLELYPTPAYNIMRTYLRRVPRRNDMPKDRCNFGQRLEALVVSPQVHWTIGDYA
jgi:hypothetical protein